MGGDDLTRAGAKGGYTDPFKDMNVEQLAAFYKKDNSLKETLRVRVNRFCHAMSHIYNRETNQLKWQWVDKKAVLESITARAEKLNTLNEKNENPTIQDIKRARQMITEATVLSVSLLLLTKGVKDNHYEKYQETIDSQFKIINDIIRIGTTTIEKAEKDYATRTDEIKQILKNAIKPDATDVMGQLVSAREKSRELGNNPLEKEKLQGEALFQETNIAISTTISSLKDKASGLLPESEQAGPNMIRTARSTLDRIETEANNVPPGFEKEKDECLKAIKEAKSRLLDHDMNFLETEITKAAMGQMDAKKVSMHKDSINNLSKGTIDKPPKVAFTHDQIERFGKLSKRIDELSQKPPTNTTAASTAAATENTAPLKSAGGVSIRDIETQKAVNKLNEAMLKLTDVSTKHLDTLEQTSKKIAEYTWWIPGAEELLKAQSEKSKLLALFDNYEKTTTPEQANERAKQIFVYVEKALIQDGAAIENQDGGLQINIIEHKELAEAYEKAVDAYNELQRFLPPK